MPQIERLPRVTLVSFSDAEIRDRANEWGVSSYWDADDVENVVRSIDGWVNASNWGAGQIIIGGFGSGQHAMIRDIIWQKINNARNVEKIKGETNSSMLEAKYASSNINMPLDFSKTQLITPSAKYVSGGQLGDMVPADRNYDNAYDAYLADYYNAFDIAYCDANAPNGVSHPDSNYLSCNLASDQYATTELKLQDFDLPLIKFDKALKDVMFYLYKQGIGLTEEGLNTTSGLNGGIPTTTDTFYYRPSKQAGKINDAQWDTLSKWFKGMIRFKVMSPRVFVEQLYFPRLTNQLMQKKGWDYNKAHDQALVDMDTDLPGVKKKILQQELKKLTEMAGEIKDTDAGLTDYCATISGYATLSTDLQKLFAEQNPEAVAKCAAFKKSTDVANSDMADPSKDPNQPDSKSSTKTILILCGVVVVIAVVGWVVWKFTHKTQ